MRTDDIYHIYKLLKIKGVGPVFLNKILSSYSSKENIVYETDKLHSFLNEDQIEEFNKPDDELQKQIDHLKEANADFISVLDPQYPKILSCTLKNSTPPILSYYGNLQLLQMSSVGFCGSRKVSLKGLEIAKDCVNQLVNQGFVIVSGYADGVDQQVHLVALESSGSTIIVLPEGLLNFKVRRVLQNIWDWNRVLVISEFLPKAVWLASRAMQRNKTIIGLSKVMVLVEAGENGGSIDAGRRSLEMKRKLYVPLCESSPGDATAGNKKLLEIGGVQLLKDKKTGSANLNELIEDVKNFKYNCISSSVQLTFL
ncbi:MAG: DNA-processing protein DprA [Sedimentisphaerales bacterium]